MTSKGATRRPVSSASAATTRSANAKPCPASAAVVVRSTRRDGPEGAMAPAPAASSHAGQRARSCSRIKHRPEDRRGIESASFSAGEGCTRRRDRRQRFSRPRCLRRRTGCRGQSPRWKNRHFSGWVRGRAQCRDAQVGATSRALVLSLRFTKTVVWPATVRLLV